MPTFSVRLMVKATCCAAIVSTLLVAVVAMLPQCIQADHVHSVPVPMQEPGTEMDSPTTQKVSLVAARWPRTLELVYCWGTNDHNDIDTWCPCAELTLHRRPREVDVFDCATGNFYPASGSWSKTGRWNEVTFDFNGIVIYHGVKQSDGSYLGTMITPSGLTGVWSGQFLP